MALDTCRVSELILEQLARSERRVLSLVVAIGKTQQENGVFKGDLTAMVKSALRTLVAARTIVESDGLYSLAPA